MRLIAIVMALGLACGCSSSLDARDGGDDTGVGGEDSAILPSIRSMSPTRVTAGSSDLTLTVIGTNFVDGFPVNTWAMWTADGLKTRLATRFVSGTKLSAVVPAKLLAEPETANVFVETADSRAVSDGVDAYAKSNVVSFEIVAAAAQAARNLDTLLARPRTPSPNGPQRFVSDVRPTRVRTRNRVASTHRT